MQVLHIMAKSEVLEIIQCTLINVPTFPFAYHWVPMCKRAQKPFFALTRLEAASPGLRHLGTSCSSALFDQTCGELHHLVVRCSPKSLLGSLGQVWKVEG